VEEEAKAAATASNVFADGGCTKGPAGHELDDEHLSAKKEPSKDELQEGPAGKEQPAGEEVDGEDLDGEELDSEEGPTELDGQELDGDEDSEVLDGEVLEMEEKEEEADSQVTLQLWGGDCNEDCICISDSDVPPSQPADPALPQKPAQPATPAQPAHAQPPEPKVALSAQLAPQQKPAHAKPAQPAQLAPARKPEQPTHAAELPQSAPARPLQTPPAQPARLLSRIELECILQGPAQKGGAVAGVHGAVARSADAGKDCAACAAGAGSTGQASAPHLATGACLGQLGQPSSAKLSWQTGAVRVAAGSAGESQHGQGTPPSSAD